MTMARSLSTQAPIHFDFSALENEMPSPKFYSVMLKKLGERSNVFYLGHVVSHLSIHDWCLMKGFQLVECFIGTRWAKPHERTDLI